MSNALKIAKANCKIFQKIAMEVIESADKNYVMSRAILELKKIKNKSMILESLKDAFPDLVSIKSESVKVQKLLREAQLYLFD